MPSITYWSRLEPRARTANLAEGLAARVRDPMWFLARQWQLGEFNGEDAGSPAHLEIEARFGRLANWSAGEGGARALPTGAPLEAVALAEEFDDRDVSLALELGGVFERALIAAGRPDLIDAFRGAYSLSENDDRVAADDARGQQLLQFAAGRSTHGVDLLAAADIAAPGLPPRPAIASPSPEEDAVRAALAVMRAWVRDTLGPIGRGDSPAWVPERLEYDLQVAGAEPDGAAVSFRVQPTHSGRADWHAFDVEARGESDGGAGAPGDTVKRSVLPTSVTFRGMPNARWWAFESGVLNIDAIRPDTRELAKLLVLDFMLIQSNDWYLAPLDQPLGTLGRIESLVVHDVFGQQFRVEPADQNAPSGAERWTLFKPTVMGSTDIVDFLLVPPGGGEVIQSSEVLEEAYFIRDEMANLVWGVEHVVVDGSGVPASAQELSAGAGPPPPVGPPAGPVGDDVAPLHYRIQTEVPGHWTPFVPVALNPTGRDVQLERGTLIASTPAPGTEGWPRGRILQPTGAGAAHTLLEQTVSRTGVRVSRALSRTRWTGGETIVWVARRKTRSEQTAESGLAHDLAQTVPAPRREPR